MSPLPSKFVDRWRDRPEADDTRQGTVYWHLLLGKEPQLRMLASRAQERLSRFSGLHMTPLEWLHITTLIAGSTNDVSDDQMERMLIEAARPLSRIHPITITLERIFYHPEAILLDVRPKHVLLPVLEAAQSATRAVLGRDGTSGTDMSSWMPHVTLCYSTAEQSADPIIAALGKRLPSCEVTIDALTLVVQRGPERLWSWHPVGSARLGRR